MPWLIAIGLLLIALRGTERLWYYAARYREAEKQRELNRRRQADRLRETLTRVLSPADAEPLRNFKDIEYVASQDSAKWLLDTIEYVKGPLLGTYTESKEGWPYIAALHRERALPDAETLGEREIPVRLPEELRDRHLAVFGRTGGGKTTASSGFRVAEFPGASASRRC